MKHVCYFILLLYGITACTKDDKQPDSNGITTGRAFFKNRFGVDSSKQLPLSYTEIFVRRPRDASDSYFQKVRTDADGNFYIDLTERPLVVYIRTTQKVLPDTTAVFYGELILTEPAPAVVGNIVAVFDTVYQRALDLTVMDNGGGVLPGSTVYFYNSISQALLNNAAFSVLSLTANSSGRIVSVSIAPGAYYLNGIKTSDTITYQRSAKPVIIPPAGVVRDSMAMSPMKETFVNGFSITVKDSLGGFIPLADIYLFNSKVLAMSNDPRGAIEALHTDKSGLVVYKSNLPAGDYYLNATKAVDTIIYQRLSKHIMMPATGMVTDTMTVWRKPD